MSSRTLRTCIHQTAGSNELDLILANCEAHRVSILPTGGNTGNAGPELGKPPGGSSTRPVPKCGVLAETVNSLPPYQGTILAQCERESPPANSCGSIQLLTM